jgi:YVTN family beta-propeller protein
VTVGKAPYCAAYDSGMGEIFVTNYNSSSVSVISDNSNTVVANITSLKQPFGCVYDSGKGEIYVVNYDFISVISDCNNTIVANVPSVVQSQSIVYDSGKGEIFVPNSEHGTVSVISDSLETSASPSTAEMANSQNNFATITPSQPNQSTPTSTSTAFVQPKNIEANTLTIYYLILIAATVVATLIVIVIVSIIRRSNMPFPEKATYSE